MITEHCIQVLCSVLREETFDWPSHDQDTFYDGFVDVARHQGVAALACHLIQASPEWEEFHPGAKAALQHELRESVAIEMARNHDLVRLLQAFDSSGLRVLLLKGTALAYSYYPHPHLRTRCDTDVFIHPSDIPQVKDVFREQGYSLLGRTYKSHQFNCHRQAFGGGIINYDVHWRATNRASYARVIGFEEAWASSVPVNGIHGGKTLNPSLSLLQACIHRAANPDHDSNRLIWLYDIHLLMSALNQRDLENLVERIRQNELHTVCHDALTAAQTCFGTSLPAVFLKNFHKAVTTPRSSGRKFRASQLGLIMDDLRELPDYRSRGAMVREYLVPPSDYLLNRYHKQGTFWVPILYLRYLLGGLYDRLSLR